MASGRTELSVVVPFYDEMHRLDATLPAIVALATDDTEVILVDDGSTDGTGAALDAAATARGVRVVHLLRNQGKGAAVRAGIGASMGRIVMYMDADLATDLADVPRLTAALA
ncbi:MAG: glycosyltransferase, partial [Ilumatobacteraceae bacterium]